MIDTAAPPADAERASPPPGHRAGEPARWLVPLAVALLAPAIALRDMLLSGFARVPGDQYDGRLNAYFVEHTWLWLTRQPLHRSFWDLPIYYPRGTNAVAFSDAMLSFGPLYWPWRALGVAPDTSYQIWIFLVMAASALAGYLFLHRAVRLSPLASALGAWLATCSASRLHQVAHSQLLPQFFVLGGLWAAIAFVRAAEPRRRWLAAAVLAGCLVAQLYGGFYLGLFLVLACVALALVALLVAGTRRALLAAVGRGWLPLLVAGGVAAVALLPWLIHYRAAHQLVGAGREWAEVASMVPQPASWLYVPREALFYGWSPEAEVFDRLPNSFEHAVGIGYLTTLAALLAVALRRRVLAVQLAVGAALLTMAVTTTIHDHSLWRWLTELVPSLLAARALCRIGLLLPLVAAVVLGVWLDSAGGRRARAAVLALFALCCVEQLANADTTDKAVQRYWVGVLADRVDPRAAAFIATRSSGPGEGNSTVLQIDAMWASNLRGVPTVNGTSGNEPPGWHPLRWSRVRNPEMVAIYLQVLREWLVAGGVDPATVQVIQLPPGYRLRTRPYGQRPPGHHRVRRRGGKPTLASV